MHPIYTIGYGNRSIDDFLRILLKYNIEYLVDIRSKPYSKFQVDFNRDCLREKLLNKGIKYVFMGDLLGGRPDDISCYTDGKTDYRKLRKQEFFLKGIERIKVAYSKNLCTVLMCTESKPQNCHRSKLIGQDLTKKSTHVVHIDENEKPVKHDDVILRITKGQQYMFDVDELFCTSNKQIKGI